MSDAIVGLVPEFHPLDPLRQVLSHERIGLLLGAIALEAIAIAVVLPVSPAFCVAINMAPPGGAVYVLWTMGLGGALGVAFMVRRVIALRDVDRTAIMTKLLYDPEDVVWVHAGFATEHRMYGETVSRSRHVVFLTESRDNHSLEMVESHAQRVLSAMETYLPHATVGAFSPEAMARYKAEPASMRLEPRDDAREGGAYRDAPVPKKKVLPAPAASPYWLAALLCVGLVLAAPTVTSLILGTPPAN